MLKTLHSQLHFVNEIQKVDTTGIEPLIAIRDESEEATKEMTIGLETLKAQLDSEEIKGRNKRPRRRRDAPVETHGSEAWNVLGTAEKTVGKYFVVDSSKE
jgi:Asp-tRNA(Asn)/Glu-tRNA(Gln) amidotransferase C subunit